MDVPAIPSPAPLPLEVISQLQEPMKALQMWLFFSLLLVGAIFDCQKRLIPNTLCALITMVGLLVFHPAQLMGPLAACLCWLRLCISPVP